MPKMLEIRWSCPNACGVEYTMEMDEEPVRDGRAITGKDLEYEKRQVERALEKRATTHLEFCKRPARAGVLQGVEWAIPPGRREKGPEED